MYGLFANLHAEGCFPNVHMPLLVINLGKSLFRSSEQVEVGAFYRLDVTLRHLQNCGAQKMSQEYFLWPLNLWQPDTSAAICIGTAAYAVKAPCLVSCSSYY